MLTVPKLVELLAMSALEPSADSALNKLTQAAIELTGSRNGMIARLDEEAGVLVLRHLAGKEKSKGENLEIGLDLREGIVAYVAATGSPIMSGNVAEDPRYRNLFDSTQSEIAVPIRDSTGRIRAVLNVESDRLSAYSADALKACEAIATMAAILIERADSLARERALIAVGSALDRAATEDELLEQVIEVASDVLRFQASSIFLLDKSSDRYVLRATVGRLKDRVGQISYKRGEGCTGWVCEMGKAIRLDHPQGDPRWRGRYLEFPSEQIASFLAVPIMIRGASIGAIRVIRRVSENEYLDTRFTESDQRVLQAIADQLAIGLDSIRSVEKLVRSERMIAWGELSAKSSHMIGNRVFALKGDVNELKHLLSEGELDRKALEEIQASLTTNVTRVEEVLRDFRDFVSATQIDRRTEDLNKLVRETVEEVFPKRARIELDLDLDPNLPKVSLDAKRLRRAISELIENAVSFMDKGRLSVRTVEASPEAVAAPGLAPARKYAVLEIADTGPGVESERKETIFQPFHSSRVKGMGLGLSIVKGIVDAHGGRIAEVGKAGEGAKFLIALPAEDRPNSEEE